MELMEDLREQGKKIASQKEAIEGLHKADGGVTS